MESIFSWKAPIMSSSLTQPRRGGVIFFCFFLNKLHLEHRNITLNMLCVDPTCSWRAPMSNCLTQPLRGGDAKTGLSGAPTGFSACLRTPYILVFIDLFLPISMFLM